MVVMEAQDKHREIFGIEQRYQTEVLRHQDDFFVVRSSFSILSNAEVVEHYEKTNGWSVYLHLILSQSIDRIYPCVQYIQS